MDPAYCPGVLERILNSTEIPKDVAGLILIYHGPSDDVRRAFEIKYDIPNISCMKSIFYEDIWNKLKIQHELNILCTQMSHEIAMNKLSFIPSITYADCYRSIISGKMVQIFDFASDFCREYSICALKAFVSSFDGEAFAYKTIQEKYDTIVTSHDTFINVLLKEKDFIGGFMYKSDNLYEFFIAAQTPDELRSVVVEYKKQQVNVRFNISHNLLFTGGSKILKYEKLCDILNPKGIVTNNYNISSTRRYLKYDRLMENKRFKKELHSKENVIRNTDRIKHKGHDRYVRKKQWFRSHKKDKISNRKRSRR
jgi:hypothetical protein